MNVVEFLIFSVCIFIFFNCCCEAASISSSHSFRISSRKINALSVCRNDKICVLGTASNTNKYRVMVVVVAATAAAVAYLLFSRAHFGSCEFKMPREKLNYEPFLCVLQNKINETHFGKSFCRKPFQFFSFEFRSISICALACVCAHTHNSVPKRNTFFHSIAQLLIWKLFYDFDNLFWKHFRHWYLLIWCAIVIWLCAVPQLVLIALQWHTHTF